MVEGGRSANSEVDDPIPTSSGTATLATGERVDLTFLNSPVNVVGRDQHNTNITVLGQLAPNKGVNYRKLIEVINDHTRQKSAISIRQDFKNEIPLDPDFDVFPQMRRVNVDDYYKGRFPVDNSLDSQNLRGSETNGFQNQLIEEVGFYGAYTHANDGESITMEELMASTWNTGKLTQDDVVGYTAITASAGSGKTTLARRIARRALGIPSSKKKDEIFPFRIITISHEMTRNIFGISSASEEGEGVPSKPKRKMIHYVELKDIKEENSLKASKFLFGGLYKCESGEDDAFEWLVEHQSEAIIIFDGLDQVRWDFEERSVRKIKPYEKSSSAIILYNILCRNILSHVKIIVTSREFKISELPAEARPNEIITLNGLTLKDAYKLFTFLLNENGKYLWEKIEIMSPRLLQLVTVPVFLILIAVVMGKDPSRPPPNTVTELYSRIMLLFQSVDNIRNRSEILLIINKLKALAFAGMSDGRVVFRKTDLERFGLSADEVQDLMTKVPGINILSRHLMEGDFTFFFCHQSMQEFLAASFVSEMKLEDFSNFNDKHLHEKRWSVVRRFVAGVLHMKDPSDLHIISDQPQKQQFIDQWISVYIMVNQVRSQPMELYTIIYETDDDDVMKKLSGINASCLSLGPDDAHIVGSLAARMESLDYLDMSFCSMNYELTRIITRCLMNPIQVKKVDLRHTRIPKIVLLRSLLGHRRIESLCGNLNWNVLMLEADGQYFTLKNEEFVIEISGSCEGHFNIKKSTLVFERIRSFAPADFFEELFGAESVKLNEQQHLLLKKVDLANRKGRKFVKVSKILLKCTDEENIDWRLVLTNMKNYEVEILDIVVTGHTSADYYNRIFGHRRKISIFGFHVNIHALFCVMSRDGFTKIVEVCLQKKIQYIRCIFNCSARASLFEIVALVNNSYSKKVTLIYMNENDMLRGDELKKAQKIANESDTSFEVLYMLRGVVDAWQIVDQDFYWREVEKTCR